MTLSKRLTIIISLAAVLTVSFLIPTTAYASAPSYENSYVPLFASGLTEGATATISTTPSLYSGFFTVQNAAVTSIRYDSATWDYSTGILQYKIVVSPEEVGGDWTIYIPYSSGIAVMVSAEQESSAYTLETSYEALGNVTTSKLLTNYHPSAFGTAATGVSQYYFLAPSQTVVAISAHLTGSVQNYLSQITITFNFGPSAWANITGVDVSNPIGVFDDITTNYAWYWTKDFVAGVVNVPFIGQSIAIVVVMIILGIAFNWIRSL